MEIQNTITTPESVLTPFPVNPCPYHGLILLVLEFQINGHMPYVLFYIWLVLLSTELLRFIHIMCMYQEFIPFKYAESYLVE